MKTTLQIVLRPWTRFALLVVIAGLVAACGGRTAAPEATATPAPPVEATEAADSVEDAQPVSPLVQAESPLLQPESPLTTPLVAPQTEAEAIALAAITEPAEPEEGLASVSGVVYSFGTVPGAVRGTQVYLEAADEVDGKFFPPAVSLGPKVADGDIIVETNDFGQLQIQVPPGHYYAAVWTIYDWKLVTTEAGDETPRLITLEEGDQVNLGVLYVYWP